MKPIRRERDADSSNSIVYSSFHLHETGLTPIGAPSFEEWLECGRFIRHAEQSVHFWIGDWLIYGEAHFKEDYEEAIALTGYSYHTLRKDKYVAAHIPPERRRSTVDVAIHQEVAPLPLQVQESLLEKAESEQLSVQQLRMEKHRYLSEVTRPVPSVEADAGLFLGDCVSVLETLPDESVDCIVTDPPYGISYQSGHRTLPFEKIANDGLDEAKAVLDQALSVAARKLRPNSHLYIFSAWRTYPEMAAIVAKYFSIKNVLVWV